MRANWIILLVSALCASTNYAQEGVLDNDCNTTLGIVRKEQLMELALTFLSPLVDTPEASREVVYKPAKYDFVVKKLCSSCLFVALHYVDEFFPIDWLTYCDEKVYGYRKFQSFLVMMPLEPGSSTEILKGYSLRAFVSMLRMPASPDDAPTAIWPANFTTFLQGVSGAGSIRQAGVSALIPSMLAASSGSVAIVPDYIGYGTAQTNPTIFWGPGYKQAAFVGWYHVRQWLELYAPCTRLDLQYVTLQGYEDGAFGIMEVAQGFRRFKTKVLRVFSDAGFLDLDQLLVHAVIEASYSRDLPGRLRTVLELAAFSFSWGNPNLNNTGTGQELVSSTWRDQIFSTYENPNFSANEDRRLQGAALPDPVAMGGGNVANGLPFLNPDLLAYYQSRMRFGSLTPCKDTNNVPANLENLCKAIAAASAYPALLGQTQYNWIHDVEFCYSDADRVVPTSQIDQGDLLNSVPLAERYNGPVADRQTFNPDMPQHHLVMETCGVGTSLFYGLQGHRPDDPNLGPDTLTRVSPELAATCGATYENEPPSAAPPTSSGGGPTGGGGDETTEDSSPVSAPTGDVDETPAADPGADDGGGSGAVKSFLYARFVPVVSCLCGVFSI